MTDVFVSYARIDQARVARIVDLLDAENFNVWWDTAIEPGHAYQLVIERALQEAKCIVVIWTKNSVSSHWVLDEAKRGQRKSNLIPILMEDTEIPLGFGGFQAADLRNWNGKKDAKEWQDVLARIRAFVPRPSGRRVRPVVTAPRIPKTFDLGKGILAMLGVLAMAVLIIALYIATRPKQPYGQNETTPSYLSVNVGDALPIAVK